MGEYLYVKFNLKNNIFAACVWLRAKREVFKAKEKDFEKDEYSRRSRMEDQEQTSLGGANDTRYQL